MLKNECDGKKIYKLVMCRPPFMGTSNNISLMTPSPRVRAEHEGGLILGTVLSSLGGAYIPWDGKAHKKEEYQVT